MQEIALFGAGCFWGVEAAFQKIPGVVDTEVGYAGGHNDHPTYQDVCSSQTGHAEVVRIHFDPNQVSYNELLNVFWNCHNPTTRNRQGPDIGSQYRSIIFYFNDQQKQQALLSKNALQQSGRYKDDIVTEIVPASPFYRAEEYHQRYCEKQRH